MLPRDQNARDDPQHCTFGRKGTSFLSTSFLSADFMRALDGGQRMRELWNNWSGTLVSVEALATLIVFAVVAAGVVTLVEGRRHKPTKD
ncbi:hypothetical protein [Bradyrhizobium liaoningense]|uniref:hypothetical protein n=1 Tax=Bradyrhizobium liaoningense TaxID=43992 RepID=UPI001BA817BB|nr:hypothetical protein [Bradyrhizobium liaoningense]MBR0718306.1 hypothetical protein [Bradyrhizobium liaoningense]